MTLFRPEALFWAVLAVPLVALYLRGDRVPRHVVSAGPLWQKVLAERTSRARWRRWRRPVSLALQLLVLFALVLALAEPANVGQAFQPDSVGQAFQPAGDGKDVRLESLTYGLTCGAWWPYLAMVAVVVLVAEWRLFQRRWTC
jgi:hypothetical protein